jgi:hypothetical protein
MDGLFGSLGTVVFVFQSGIDGVFCAFAENSFVFEHFVGVFDSAAT